MNTVETEGGSKNQRETIFRVYSDDSVSLEDGTGILHVAPAYGESDLDISKREGIPAIESIDRSGKMNSIVGDKINKNWLGMFFKEADPHIVADLAQKGRIFAAETFTHTYPFCYRCDSPLLYFAISTWFIGVSQIRDDMLRTAEHIEWTPAHIKSGRFGKWLEGARDWAISRNRYWGAPLPIWVNDTDELDYIVVGSLDELVELAGLSSKPDDLHRPDIDKIVINQNGKTYRRVDEVFDCWFESGAMPFAQAHYPFENKDVFENSFPADYVGEGLDQTRLWFYVQHVLATIIFDRPAYRHVLVNGMVMAADGQKLSKRLRNYPPVEEVFAVEGSDTLRFYLLGNDQALGGDYMRFNRDAMKDINRNVFMTTWNVHSFLTMYAELNNWNPPMILGVPVSENVLDQWLLSRLNQTINEVTLQADAFKLAAAIRPLRELVDDLSNWYVRRSRRRFSRSDNPADQASAMATLHFVLVRLSQLMAPWSPFFADKLWRDLTAGTELRESVHLSDWPKSIEVDQAVVDQMRRARQVVVEGLNQRAKASIKVRQPLLQLSYGGEKLVDALEQIIADEVNVKLVKHEQAQDDAMTVLVTELTPELKREGLVRDLIRLVQVERKNAGLSVDDKIKLKILTDSHNVVAACEDNNLSAALRAETLADDFRVSQSEDTSAVPHQLGEDKVWINLTKII